MRSCFNVVDSFDTHARIPEHFDDVDAAAKESGHVGHYFCGLGSGHVLLEPYVCERDPAGGHMTIRSGVKASARDIPMPFVGSKV